MSTRYIVRTIYLANYFQPSAELRRERRSTTTTDSLIDAMRRTELANETLADELNAFADKGLRLINLLPHPQDVENPHDLMVTGVFEKID